MANADFFQENKNPGGFDADSYREAQQPNEERSLTPVQQKLAALEQKLPAALGKQAVALGLSVVIMAAAFLGVGSAKVRGKYNDAREWYTDGVAADHGYNLNEELTTRQNTAANIITTGINTLGADNAEVQAAQKALEEFEICKQFTDRNGGGMRALYLANEELGTDIDQLYAKLQEVAQDPMKMGAVQGQYGQFNSSGTILGTLKYNDAVYEYQNEVGGFPANVLGSLAGVKEVQPFA